MGLSQVDFPERTHPFEVFSATIQASEQSASDSEANMPFGTQGELEEDSSDEGGIPVDLYPSQENLPVIVMYQPLRPTGAPLFHPDAFTPPPRLI